MRESALEQDGLGYASRQLNRALSGSVEVVHPSPTRFGAATAAMSRLDRFYLSSPRSRRLAADVEVQVPLPHDVVAARGLSDQSLVYMHLDIARRGPGSTLLLWEPPARSEEYAKILKANLAVAGLDSWDASPPSPPLSVGPTTNGSSGSR